MGIFVIVLLKWWICIFVVKDVVIEVVIRVVIEGDKKEF